MRESATEANRDGTCFTAAQLDGAVLPTLHVSVATDSVASRGSLVGLEGSLFDGRFRIDERVAEGGFAVVYKAWQLALDRRVALKVLKAPKHHDEVARAEYREKFAVEARTIARLRHVHIVDVYDFSVATLPSGELAPWMALEWLEGETLAKHLAERRRAGERGRDPVGAVDFLRPVLEALAHAHAHGIAHRDIKPSNVMVVETKDGPSLRVLDFGIAKVMVDDGTPNTGNTRTESQPAFSPAYAAPEQVAFSRTGPWTDVHALGLMLTEVMTDEPPFSDADPHAHLFEQVMATVRPTPRNKGREVGAFEPILARALALAPRDRFRSAVELLAALDEARAGGGEFSAGAADTAPATVVGRPRPAAGASSGRRLVPMVAAATALAAGLAFLASRELSPAPPGVAPPLATSPLPVATSAAAIVNVPAVPTPAVAPPVAAPAASVPSPSPAATAKVRRKAQKAAPSAEPRTAAVDGRDLFNDTK